MNYFDFSGGMVNRVTPYLRKTDQVASICNFDIQEGGLKVRAGTKKLCGPFLDEVIGIHKALSTKGHEILFVQTKARLELAVGNIRGTTSMAAPSMKVVHTTDGFGFLVGEIPVTLKRFYLRCDGIVTVDQVNPACLFLEKLEDDYETNGEFPEDLYGKMMIDSATNTLYYCKSHTAANKNNITQLLATDAFSPIGKIGDILVFGHQYGDSYAVNLKTVQYQDTKAVVTPIAHLMQVFNGISDLVGIVGEAFHCKYFVWHPASMRYFAAGNPDHPTALYISEPNNWCNFQKGNVLYPHLHLGQITGLSVVEKSVVVSYEYGWSHYEGSDPTDDGQWSLISVPDGAKFGQTVCLTPGSVSFYSGGELLSFSSSMLTTQMLYSPSSNLYKFLSKDKIKLPTPVRQAFAHYKNGIYYLVLDDTMYVYHYFLSAFTCYQGITCQCITESYDGRLLLGCGKYIATFCDTSRCDYDPVTDSESPISYQVTIPLLGETKENEIGRCTEVTIKAKSLQKEADCSITVTSERDSVRGTLQFADHLLYGTTPWKRRYQDSDYSESRFLCQVSGNIFLLEIQGSQNPEEPEPFHMLNIYTQVKKERNK